MTYALPSFILVWLQTVIITRRYVKFKLHAEHILLNWHSDVFEEHKDRIPVFNIQGQGRTLQGQVQGQDHASVRPRPLPVFSLPWVNGWLHYG